MDLCNVNICASKFFIQCHTGSSCVHVTGGIDNINNLLLVIYICVSVSWSLYPVCVFVCAISNQSTSRNQVIYVKR